MDIKNFKFIHSKIVTFNLLYGVTIFITLILIIISSSTVIAQTKNNDQITLSDSDFAINKEPDGKIVKELLPGRSISSTYAFHNGSEFIVYLYSGSGKGYTTSKDGVSWSEITLDDDIVHDGPSFPDDGIVVANGHYFNNYFSSISYDGKNWEYYNDYILENPLQYERISYIYWTGKNYIASTNQSRLLTSSDLKNWKDTKKQASLTSVIKDPKTGQFLATGFVYATGKMVSGPSPALLKSTDGITFSTVKVMNFDTEYQNYVGYKHVEQSEALNSWNSTYESKIYIRNGQYYALCSSWGLTSTDGKTWNIGEEDFPRAYACQAAGATIDCPSNGIIKTSYDEKNWKTTDFNIYNYFQRVSDGATNGTNTVLMGESEIYISNNNMNWTVKTFKDNNLTEVAYIDGLYYLMGYINSNYESIAVTYTSKDGFNWVKDDTVLGDNASIVNNFFKLGDTYVMCYSMSDIISMKYSKDMSHWTGVQINGLGYVASPWIDLDENLFLKKGDIILRLNWAQPLTTKDFVTWTKGYYGDNNHAEFGFVKGDEFVYFKSEDVWITSKDGVKWFQTTAEKLGIAKEVMLTGNQKYFSGNLSNEGYIYDETGAQKISRPSIEDSMLMDDVFTSLGQVNKTKELLVYGDIYSKPDIKGGFMIISDPIRIKLNNEILWIMTDYPYLSKGTTLVPLRGLFEKMGATVNWDSPSQTASITLNDQTISITKGCQIAKVNGIEVPLVVMPEIRNDKLYVPLRFAAEAIGADVDWDKDTMTVIINQ